MMTNMSLKGTNQILITILLKETNHIFTVILLKETALKINQDVAKRDKVKINYHVAKRDKLKYWPTSYYILITILLKEIKNIDHHVTGEGGSTPKSLKGTSLKINTMLLECTNPKINHHVTKIEKSITMTLKSKNRLVYR